jgi:hypothetical protein
MELQLDTRRKFGFFFKNLLSISTWIAAAAVWNAIMWSLPQIGAMIFAGLSVLAGIVWLAWWEAGNKLISAQIEERHTARLLELDRERH